MGQTLVNGLLQLAATFGAIVLICRICDFWWGKQGGTKLRSSIEDFWVRSSNALPEDIALKPLGVLSTFYDRLFGPGPFSKQAFLRTSLVSTLILIVTLSITGIVCNKPFGLSEWPWDKYETQRKVLSGLAESHQTKSEKTPLDETFQVNAADIASMQGVGFQIAFTFCFVIVLVATTCVLNSLCLAVSRLILSEMAKAKSAFSLLLMLAVNVLVTVIFFILASLILFLGLNIACWPFVPLLFALSSLHALAGAAVIVGTTIIAWFFTDPWLKTVVLVSLTPVATLAFVLGGCALGFPFRRFIKTLTTKFLERSLENEKGLFSFFGEAAFLLASTIALIIKLCGG